MGRLLSRLLKPYVSRLILVSRDLDRAKLVARRIGVDWGGYDSTAYADICVVAVPSMFVVDTIYKISNWLKTGSIVSDISSVKTYVVSKVSRILPSGIEYISLHPLFGPSVKKISKLKIVVIPARCSEESLGRIVSLLKDAGLEVILSTVDEHDRMMSIIQCIHHLSYMTLALTLMEYAKPDDIEKYSTVSLKYTLRLLKRFRRILDVIKEIQELNPYYGECRVSFIDYARRLSLMDDEAWRILREALDKLSTIKT